MQSDIFLHKLNFHFNFSVLFTGEVYVRVVYTCNRNFQFSFDWKHFSCSFVISSLTKAEANIAEKWDVTLCRRISYSWIWQCQMGSLSDDQKSIKSVSDDFIWKHHILYLISALATASPELHITWYECSSAIWNKY